MHRKFSHNCGFEFFTPEAFFEEDYLNVPKTLDYNPQLLMHSKLYKNDLYLDPDTVYVVVGLPRIGKTTFLSSLGNKQILFQPSEMSTMGGDNIYIVDGEYNNVFSRAPIIREAKKRGRTICALYFSCNNFIEWSHIYMYLSIKNNISIESETNRNKVYSRFAKPRSSEGFDSIIEVHEYLTSYEESLGNLYLI